MVLKPQDLLSTLKLIASGRHHDWRFNELAIELCMSVSETHAGMKRAQRAGFVYVSDNRFLVSAHALEEFLLHGVRYVFVPDRGEITRGLPTAHAAPPLKRHIASNDDPPPVWPTLDGTVRGQAFSPLYKAAPQAAMRDAQLYELLVIVDALRGGRAREKQIATTELQRRLANYDR